MTSANNFKKGGQFQYPLSILGMDNINIAQVLNK